MGFSLIVAVLVVAAFGGVALSLLGFRRRASAETAALRQELQMAASSQSQAVTAQFAQLTQAFTAQLAQVTQQVQTGVASAGSLATEAQKAVSDQLRASTEMFAAIRQQLGQVQEAGRELSGAAQQLE
jgi:site-specific recombinase